MTTKAELQDLLRFLTQDAKLPLKEAMGKVKDLQKASLTSPTLISKTPLPNLTTILNTAADSKLARQVLAAAKRAAKKRDLPTTTVQAPISGPSSPSKRQKTSSPSPSDLEASLTLPTLPHPISIPLLSQTVLIANRAPLLLAFAAVCLAYTHPHQPLSSRLSLAQAVVSASSRSKAVHLGLKAGRSAEEEGWGAGQPALRVMGREVRVLRRWGYEPVVGGGGGEEEGEELGGDRDGDGYTRRELDANEASFAPSGSTLKEEEEKEEGEEEHGPEHSRNAPTTHPPAPPQETQQQQHPHPHPPRPQPPASVPLWALDTEALRASNTAKHHPSHSHPHSPFSATAATATATATSTPLPIHTPHSARSYLLKSFASPPSDPPSTTTASSKKPAAAARAQEKEKERNCALLLTALDRLFASWAPMLGAEELDRRAWGWYVAVRPEVEGGARGWGGRGPVKLAAILGLRREG